MLNLASDTDPAWLGRALENLDAILLDHAHCEKKAAGSILRLLFQYPHHAFLQAPLARVAREELLHFEQVLAELEARGVAFERQRPSAYGGRLHQRIRGREPDRLIDWLLICALIEARSCERFALLADAVPDPKLSALYRGLLASEARHHQMYVELAWELAPRDAVRDRLAELAVAEASALAKPEKLVRLHSGAAAG